MARQTFATFLKDEAAQSTTEFVLLVALIGVPLFMGARKFLKEFLRIYIENVIENFTKGM